jgi:hypothetical protein
MAAPLNNRVNRRCVLIVAAACMIIGCRSEPRSAVKPGTVGWRPIESWSGHENIQTESFNIESGQLRIKWETKNEAAPGAGKFKVMVRSAVSGRPIALAVEHQGVGRDTAYVSDEPRLYFLEIESSGVDWTVKVEEAVVAGGAIQP